MQSYCVYFFFACILDNHVCLSRYGELDDQTKGALGRLTSVAVDIRPCYPLAGEDCQEALSFWSVQTEHPCWCWFMIAPSLLHIEDLQDHNLICFLSFKKKFSRYNWYLTLAKTFVSNKDLLENKMCNDDNRSIACLIIAGWLAGNPAVQPDAALASLPLPASYRAVPWSPFLTLWFFLRQSKITQAKCFWEYL